MLDGGLTHMNGRLYDPVLARFVSADPHVDNPFDLQSLNRYSYVNNNPLGYTDPTGYFKLFGKKWSWWRDKVVKPVVAIAVSIYAPGIINGLTGWGATASQIAAGAISGSITGGGQGALMGAFSAGLFTGLHGMDAGFAKVLAHGVAGGIMSELQGGEFQSGFLAGAFTQGVSQLGGFDRLGNPSTLSGRTANAGRGRGQGFRYHINSCHTHPHGAPPQT